MDVSTSERVRGEREEVEGDEGDVEAGEERDEGQSGGDVVSLGWRKVKR